MKSLNSTHKVSNKLKKTGLLLLFAVIGLTGSGQNYAWMKGSTTYDPIGVYGVLGTPSNGNNPGGRETAITWTDASGNFWVFGGFGIDNAGSFGFLNDLWKYTVTTNQWTWMNGADVAGDDGNYGTLGVPSALNLPGARQGAASWTDASGNLWMFGGTGFDSGSSIGDLSDLWKYNPTTGQWTWVKGSGIGSVNGTYGTQGTPANANNPGGRSFSAAWTDNSGNLWLMGGFGFDGTGNYGDLNDLWKYNITTNQWTWMKGANGVDNNGIYGTQGTAAIANTPGSRFNAAHFTDLAGNLWLSGGAGFDGSSSFEELLNDLWKYNPTTNQWTWVNGSNISAQNGVYGTMGVPSALNMPGGRVSSACMRDGAGDFYIFGGYGYDSAGGADAQNDLWKYDVSANQWTWLKGSNFVGQNGVYGTQGVTANANTPGARGGTHGFTDALNNLWVFGGFGEDDGSSGQGELNDLWKLLSCANAPTVSIASSTTAICLGSSFSFTASGAGTYSWSTNQTGAVISATPSAVGQYTIGAMVTDANGCTDVTGLSLNVFGIPGVYATTNKLVICKGEQAVISATNGASYVWNTTPAVTSASIAVSPTVTTIYAVTGTDINGCSKTFSVSQTVNLCTGIADNNKNTAAYVTYPNPNKGHFTISGPMFGENISLVIYNALGQKVFEDKLTASETNVQTNLGNGIYHYNIVENNNKIATGKIVIE